MADLVPVIFYMWLIASTVALVVYRRRKAAERRATEEASDSESPGPRSGGIAPTARPVAPIVPRYETPGPTPATPRQSAAAPGDRKVESARVDPSGRGAERRGLFASGEDTSARTIAEALTGVTWPCGLVPVIRSQDIHQVDRRVVFSTVGVPAAEVGRQVADRLEEAGFEVSSLDEATALARRGSTVVAMVIHPVAEKVLNDGHPEFPTLPPESVVLVCDLRGAGT